MKERKNKKRKQEGTSTPGGELKVKRGSHTQKSPFTVGKSARAERGLVRNAATGLWKAGHSRNCAHDLCCCLHTPAWVRCPWCGQGLSDGKWCLKNGPREGTTAGCEKTAWRDRSKEFHNWECFQKKLHKHSDFSRRNYRSTSLGHHRSKVPLLSGMQGGGLHSNLLPSQPASWLHGR